LERGGRQRIVVLIAGRDSELVMVERSFVIVPPVVEALYAWMGGQQREQRTEPTGAVGTIATATDLADDDRFSAA